MGKPKRKLTKYNKCMSRELKGKLSGKTKAQRASLFKAAAKRCSGKTRSASSKPKTRVSPKKRSNPSGGTRNMTKNSFNMSKIYGLVRKLSLAAPAIGIIIDPSLTPWQKMDKGTRIYSGYSFSQKKWKWEWLMEGWMPYIGTSVMTRLIIPGINKMIRWIS